MTVRLFGIIVCFFISTAVCLGQQKDENSVESNKIIIANQSNKTFAWGSAKQLQNAFGPKRAIKRNNEMLAHAEYDYNYDGLEVAFDGKDCDAITIKGNSFKAILNGQPYTIGDDISRLKNQFPISFKKREVNKKTGGRLWIGITSKGVYNDAFIIISYNKANTITEIWIGNDNS